MQPVGETHTTASATGGARPLGVDGPAAAALVTLSDDVRRACNLARGEPRASVFDIDAARLRPRGEDVLARVAACVVSGKLGDESLTLVGHTDPRGSPSYNEQLGLYRAIAAKQYLAVLGVPEERLVVDSAGERGARGTDEASWSLDRTIEIRMTRSPGDIPR